MTMTNDLPRASLDEVRWARAYLLAVTEPPATAVVAFVAAVGPIEAAKRIRSQDVPPDVATATARRVAENLPESVHQANARLIIPEDDEWPAALGALASSAPLALWARGSARLCDAVNGAVTISGSRACTSYGEYIAADWGYALARDAATVTAGASYGIEAAAHRGALAAEGVTIAVLGCGLDAGYPAGHDALLQRIAETGLIVSEYPPETRPARRRLRAHLRLMAALSTGTVIVEADQRGGALGLAECTTSLDKPVMAVPGAITSRTSAPCHDLIRSGRATLVSSAQQVLDTLDLPERR